jgi:hypothetical protein
MIKRNKKMVYEYEFLVCSIFIDLFVKGPILLLYGNNDEYPAVCRLGYDILYKQDENID